MNKELEEAIVDVKCLKFLLTGKAKEQYERPLKTVLNYIENSIPKETIKEKIEEYKEIADEDNRDYFIRIETLEELL